MQILLVLLFHVLSTSRRVSVLNTNATKSDTERLFIKKRKGSQDVICLQELRPDLEKVSSAPEFHELKDFKYIFSNMVF